MDIHCFGRAASFSELELGACFGFERRGKLYLAVKYGRTAAAQESSGGVVIWPGHPELGDQPGVYAASVFDGPVVHLTKAKFAVSMDGADFHPDYASFDAGPFIQYGGRLVVFAGSADRQPIPIDLEKGTIAPRPDGSPAFRIRKWKIIQPAPNDRDYDTICEYPAPLPA